MKQAARAASKPPLDPAIVRLIEALARAQAFEDHERDERAARTVNQGEEA